MIHSQILASGGFWAPIANPLAAVLAFLYTLVPNYGIAIVLLTIAMMILLTPLTIKQTRSMLVMQKLQPEMKKLQEQHKNDRQALNEAVMALYKEHNASPLGGCLPMLLPFPLFIALLKVLEGLSRIDAKTKASIPKYLSANTTMYKNIVKANGKLDAFGMDLAKSAKSAGGGFAHSLPFFVLLLLMVGTQFYQQYQLTSKNPAVKSQPGQAMMMKLIPLIFGVISLAFPAGVVLYWTVSNIIRIGQQWALYRYDPKVKALVTKDVKEIEAKTREIDAQETKLSGRDRLRGFMSGATGAAADGKGAAGKNDAKPGASGAGAKGATPSRGVRGAPGAAKSTRPGTAAGKAAGSQKATPQKPGSPRPATTKPGAARPAGTKPAGVKPVAGATKAGGTKPGGARPGGATPAGSGSGTNAGGVRKAVPTKPASKPVPSKPAVSKGVAAKTEAPKSGPGKAATPDGSANDANGTDAAPAAAANGTNGSVLPSGNGGAPGVGSDAVETNGTGAPIKGRTGGGSARNVTGRRRPKGR